MNGIVREGRVVRSLNAERRSVEISGREWLVSKVYLQTSIVGNNSLRSGVLQVIDDVNDWRFDVLHDLRSFAFANDLLILRYSSLKRTVLDIELNLQPRYELMRV